MGKISAFGLELRKRFPYIVGVFVILAGLAVIQSYRNTAHAARDAASAAGNAASAASASKRNSVENQKLLKQSVELTKLNAAYSRCLFTVLAPLEPFNIKDLDSCDFVVASLSAATTSATSPTVPQPSSPGSLSSPPDQTTTSSPPKQENNPQPRPSVLEQAMGTVNNFLKVIGL